MKSHRLFLTRAFFKGTPS